MPPVLRRSSFHHGTGIRAPPTRDAHCAELGYAPSPVLARFELALVSKRRPGTSLTGSRGDLDDEASLDAALANVDVVILVSPAIPAQELAVVAAATRAGVRHIVKVTSKASPDSPIARRRGRSEIEAGLAASGVAHTLLRANAYMQNFLMLAPAITATGGFASSAADGRVGLVDARDVAAVAAQIATHPDAHSGKT
jgi:uncharacterized protein YbjT (DUF2867 family)